ncbi:XdhC/CoxI family protein [Loktanella sp. 3ANDIMAR09]|uniref:XdhC family protein n=1 Tax=Loktanella sp. 3ANDIMAR09 TaxID=1225657 RepID=UPI0006F82CD4|nr:XdhC family protein [Loktanella sp. 3ANDIMAR09]KQI68751.1 XdhC/CoxI family protein [Loktanella sp. 3ANDIMAR09]
MTPHLLTLALDWHRAGRAVAVATVIETWGSAPRGVGSLLVIDGDGNMEGSVSGGCVEGAVILEAIEALQDGKPRLLDYGVSDDDAFAVGLACGGRIRVLVEPVGGAMPLDVLETLCARIAAKDPVAYVIDLEGGARRVAVPADHPDRFRLDRSGVEDDARTFVAVHNPPLRMIVVGAVHIAQVLLPMARACGFDPVLIDPRGVFGSADRFPGETIIEDWPDAALTALAPDSRTAVVTLTHDPKLDDPAIMQVLGSEAFYLGCLGSTRTHAKRVARLTEAGFTAAQIDRIHAPVGLDLGGRAPAEIAVSVMAQVIATLRRAP